MSDTDENKPAGKPGQRNRKGEQRRQKSGQPQSPNPDQLQSPKPDQLQSGEPDPPQRPEPDRQPDASEPIEATVASPDSSPAGAAADSVVPGSVPVSMQTIANAYGDFTMKSLEETRSFVEKLTGVRSLDKAMEVQTEFAKQACQTFVAESEKIRGLHRELAKQIFKPLESIIAKSTRDPR
jgi:phasin family protein